MSTDHYLVNLNNVFEGPMDLLIYLIKKDEINIYDIPVATITEQYLLYLEFIKYTSLDSAGDFILMAATLVQIKSKMLIPVYKEDEQEDPRLEIARPLLEYLQIKSVSEQLSDFPILGEDIFIRQCCEKIIEEEEEVPIKIGIFELINAFQNIAKNINQDHIVKITDEHLSVQERIKEISALIEEKGSIAFDELFIGSLTKIDMIVTFLAILEMCKLSLIRIVQYSQCGIIRVFNI
ncbi:MAG: segregation/condensation protein A [Desulfobacterales bacterium]|nr:segregation/condensation protein A [Desulfobacterales bacterium]